MRLAVKLAAFSKSLAIVILLAHLSASGKETQAQAANVATGQQQVGTTVVYGQAFFDRYSNAVTARDLIRRIPGGNAILAKLDNGEDRGFSRNVDLILINGKRISGKQNTGGDALDRISVEQIARIELIRGSSPDIKVSTQEAIINIVLVEGAQSGSGSWRGTLRVNPRGKVRGGAALSYGRSFGAFDLLGSVEYDAYPRIERRREATLDGQGRPVALLDERLPRVFEQLTVSANATYNFANGDQLRLNGQFQLENFRRDEFGNLLEPTGGGAVIGERFRFDRSKEPNWEIGADYATDLGEDWRLDLLALRSQVDERDRQGADEQIESEPPSPDFIFRSSEDARETIGRAAITWSGLASHEIEVGSEYAVNVVDSMLTLLERQNGGLQPVTLPGGDVRVQEDRSESFVIDTWQMTGKLSLETSVFFEYSRITQAGSGVDRSRTFRFLRPSADLRFDMTDRQQIQLTVRRDVSQLNFADFASSVSRDDEVVAGNENLVPEKTWAFEGQFEYRLADDQGAVALNVFHERISDAIERIAVLPGVSGVGNVGDATKSGVGIEGNLRLFFIGLPDVLVEAEVAYRDTAVTDVFTGENRTLNFQERWEVEAGFRHDLEALGLSYGLDYRRDGFEAFRDIDEIVFDTAPRHFLDVFAEVSLWRGVNFRFEANNLLDPDVGRRRELFAGGRPGPVTGVELRDRRNGRTLNFSLNGVF